MRHKSDARPPLEREAPNGCEPLPMNGRIAALGKPSRASQRITSTWLTS